MASNIRRSSSIGRSSLDRDALVPVPAARRMSSSTPVANSRVQWIFFALGASVLLSWNSLITATPYFLSRLDGTGYKSTFSSYLSATYTASNFGFLALATASFKPSSASRTIRKSMLLIVIMLFLLAASPMLPLEGSFFFFFIIFNSMIQASAGSYLQTAVAGLGALFGPQILQYAFTGQAAVGVIVSVVQYISLAVSLRGDNFQGGTSGTQNETSKTSLSSSAFIFFGIATGYMVLSLAAHALLIRMPAYLAIIKPFEQPRELLGEEEPSDNFLEQSENQPFLSGIIDVQFPGKGNIWEVANTNIVYNIAVAYVFVVTLSVFPPITSSILSVHRDSTSGILAPALFISFHFLTFNVGDWLGRYLCAFPRLRMWSPRRLAVCSLLRTLFIPLFLSCNVSRGTQSPPPSLTAVITEAAPIINSDLIFFAILLAFGVSGGYLSSMCIIAASSLENNSKIQKEQVDTAATVAQFFLIGGIFVGSIMSFGVRATICNCNPFYG